MIQSTSAAALEEDMLKPFQDRSCYNVIARLKYDRQAVVRRVCSHMRRLQILSSRNKPTYASSTHQHCLVDFHETNYSKPT